VAVIWFGDAPLAALLGMLAALGAREFYALVRSEGAEPFATAGVVMSAAAPLVAHAGRLDVVRIPTEFAVMLMIGFLGVALWKRGPAGKPASAVALTLLGAAYTGVTLAFAYQLRYHNYSAGAAAGTVVLMFPVVLTWTYDTAAFAIGRAIGRRKLMPLISPGKTVEGTVAGFVAAAVVSLLYVLLVLRPVAQLALTTFGALSFGIAIAAAAQVGDLAESMLKRTAGVKDSSNLLPGHGGVLDRLDSLYFVLPLAFWMLNVMLLAAPQGR
jgi:phosphatidate cytidylyltransferase